LQTHGAACDPVRIRPYRIIPLIFPVRRPFDRDHALGME
jgi:hypothetical protein